MKMPEFSIALAIFLLIFTSASLFLQDFNINVEKPKEVTKAWNEAYEQILAAKKEVDKNYNKITGGGIEAVVGVFGLAFSGIFYIIVSLWAILVSIPSSVVGAFNYVGSVLGVPSQILVIITAIITVVVVLKAIEFLTGRIFT